MEKPSSLGYLSRSSAHIASVTSSSLISSMRRAFSSAMIFELNGERKASFYLSFVCMSDVYKLRKWENASSFISGKKFIGGLPSRAISFTLFFNSRALVFLWKKEVFFV